MAASDSSELDRQTSGTLPELTEALTAQVQALFLSRLRSLLDKRHGGAARLTEAQGKLLDKAIYSTFCDCLELGMNAQARALLREHSN